MSEYCKVPIHPYILPRIKELADKYGISHEHAEELWSLGWNFGGYDTDSYEVLYGMEALLEAGWRK